MHKQTYKNSASYPQVGNFQSYSFFPAVNMSPSGFNSHMPFDVSIPSSDTHNATMLLNSSIQLGMPFTAPYQSSLNFSPNSSSNPFESPQFPSSTLSSRTQTILESLGESPQSNNRPVISNENFSVASSQPEEKPRSTKQTKRKNTASQDEKSVDVPKRYRIHRVAPENARHARENLIFRETIANMDAKLQEERTKNDILLRCFEVSSTPPMAAKVLTKKEISKLNLTPELFDPNTVLTRNGFTFFYTGPGYQQPKIKQENDIELEKQQYNVATP